MQICDIPYGMPYKGLYMGGYENMDVPVWIFKKNIDIPVAIFHIQSNLLSATTNGTE